MTTAIYYTSRFQGQLLTLCIAEWARKIRKSTSFLQRRLAEAKEKGLDDPIAYVIEQASTGVARKRKNTAPGAKRQSCSSAEGFRRGREEIFARENAQHIQNFLFNKSVRIEG